MAKTVFLQIRITPQDRDRLKVAATQDYLDLSTWARRVLLSKLDEMDVSAPSGRASRGSGTAAKKKRRR